MKALCDIVGLGAAGAARGSTARRGWNAQKVQNLNDGPFEIFDHPLVVHLERRDRRFPTGRPKTSGPLPVPPGYRRESHGQYGGQLKEMSAMPTIPQPGTPDSGYRVDFVNVSTVGLESSPVAKSLAGLRANEARYFKNKFDHVFTVVPAATAQATVDWVHRILRDERGITIASRPLEATSFEIDGTRWAYVFYESGLSINVLLEPAKRAVGFKLSEGMEVPTELASFKFARQNSKLAGTIRGSFFLIKGEY